MRRSICLIFMLLLTIMIAVSCSKPGPFKVELEGKTFVEKKQGGFTEYTFSKDQLNMLISFKGKEYKRSLDIVKIDNSIRKLITFPSKEEQAQDEEQESDLQSIN